MNRLALRAWATALVAAPLVAMSVPPGAAAQVAGASRSASADRAPAAVSGVVRLGDLPGGVGGLRGAAVEIRQGTTLRRVRSDDEGRYLIEGLEPGPAELVVVHLAGHPLAVRLELPEGRRVSVDLTLTARAIEVAGIQVRARPAPSGPITASSAPRTPRSAIRLEGLEASPGIVESGLVAAMRGGDEPTGPDRVLYLRGSTIDARLVLLDGAPILSPFHVAGLVDPFPAELVGRTDRYLGGAPASYSDGVSYVLDMETRAPEANTPQATARADGLTLGATVTSPLPLGGSLVTSGRWLHGAQESLGGGDAFPYAYREGLVRAEVRPAADHALRLTGFATDEGIRLDLMGPGQPTSAEWGNRALAFGYDWTDGPVGVRVTAAASRYVSTLPVALEEPQFASGAGDRRRLGLEGNALGLGGLVRMGASAERLEFTYDVTRGPSGSTPGRLRAGTTSVGAFGEWEGFVLPRLLVRAGLRADRLAEGSGVRVSPRAAATLSLPGGAELSSALGLYHQVLPAPGLHAVPDLSAADGSERLALAWNPSLPVATAFHWLVGLRQDLGAGVSAGLTGFVKRFSELGPGLGRSNASGTEIQVAREGDRVRGWFGYGLSWFWADAEGPDGAARFDSRHLVSAGIDADLGAGVEVRGSLGYGSGLPMTAVGLPSSASDIFRAENADPLVDGGTSTTISQAAGGAVLELAPEGDFLRLDLEVARSMEATIAGRATVLRPYFRMVNALNRRDALFYYYDRWLGDDARPVATRPVLPLAGIQVSF